MITKDKIDEVIKLNGVVFVNDLSENFDRKNFIYIIDKLHEIGINNQKIKVKVYCKECGKEKQMQKSQCPLCRETFEIEAEWIGQRGSKFKVLKKEGRTIYLQMIGQLQI